jgi:hypothetical protein
VFLDISLSRAFELGAHRVQVKSDETTGQPGRMLFCVTTLRARNLAVEEFVQLGR